MDSAIEQLIRLQEHDQRIGLLIEELNDLPIQREALESRLRRAEQEYEELRLRIRQLESKCKELELEEKRQRELVIKYLNQQLMTRKNEEYQALTREIENCRSQIDRLQEEQLALLDQIEQEQQLLKGKKAELEEVRKEVERGIQLLELRRIKTEQELEQQKAARRYLAEQLPSGLLGRYERIRAARGNTVVVGIEHRICGGCRMRLPPHVVVSVQTAKEIITCPNCGRILYYHPRMDLMPKE